jgi:hypothetical protein
MRGSARNKTSSTFTKFYLLVETANGKTIGKPAGGGSGKGKGDTSIYSNSNSFYTPSGNGSMLAGQAVAQNLAPTVTISSVDPSSLVPGDVDIYIYGTNLSITTGVALKLNGVTYTATNWAYDSDALGAPANPNLYVELPASIIDFDVFGLFAIVITNSYGSTEFPAMVNYGENYVGGIAEE